MSNERFEDVLSFIFGLWLLLANKYFAEAARRYGKATTGVDSGSWFTRIGFIIGGVFFILVGIRNC